MALVVVVVVVVVKEEEEEERKRMVTMTMNRKEGTREGEVVVLFQVKKEDLPR
jgi:hypothetical protein